MICTTIMATLFGRKEDVATVDDKLMTIAVLLSAVAVKVGFEEPADEMIQIVSRVTRL